MWSISSARTKEQPVGSRRLNRLVRRPVRLLAVSTLAGLVLVAAAESVRAQSTPGIVPPASATSKNVAVIIGIPNAAVPNNVTGFTVTEICSSFPNTSDGTFSSTSQSVGVGATLLFPTAYNDLTQCSFRLTVLGSGNRPLILTANSVDAVDVGFRYVDTVNGVTVDPQTVVEVGPFLIKPITSVRFGAAPPVTTTTTAPTTTLSPTTLPVPTTTLAPATTPTTMVPSTTVVSTTLTTVVVVRPTTTIRSRTKTVRVCTKRVRGRCTKTKLVTVRR
jgi:hypothetical protein